MSESKLPHFTEEQIERGMKAHIESSRHVTARRTAEVQAVLGPVPMTPQELTKSKKKPAAKNPSRKGK